MQYLPAFARLEGGGVAGGGPHVALGAQLGVGGERPGRVGAGGLLPVRGHTQRGARHRERSGGELLDWGAEKVF